MKKRKPPIRKYQFESFSGTLYNYEDHPLISYVEIKNLLLEKQEDYRIILDSCNLTNVNFIGNTFLRTEFIDCIFKNCDFSNNTFTESTFIRCEFLDCKFIGTHLVENYLNDILFKESNLSYLDSTKNRLKVIEVDNSNLRESNWFENQNQGISFYKSNLKKAIIDNTSFKDVDVSTCDIDGIQIDQFSLKGLKIASYQAPAFCKLLGIKIV